MLQVLTIRREEIEGIEDNRGAVRFLHFTKLGCPRGTEHYEFTVTVHPSKVTISAIIRAKMAIFRP